MTKTPGVTFLKASLSKKMILFNPDQDKKMVLRLAKKDTDMAYVKKRGYYIVDPNHVYIESSSKIPCAITFGGFAESIDPKGAEFAEKLREAGINNYIDMINYFYEDVEFSAEELLLKKMISVEKFEKNPDKMYIIKQPKKGVKPLKIFGKSVPFSNIVMYFSKNTRADLIESKIQHRISAIRMEKLGGAGNLLKWAVIAGILMICGALAYTMITMNRPPPAGTAQTAATAVGGIIGKTADSIAGSGSTGLS